MINQFKMLPTTPTRGYFGIWIRFFRMIISFDGKLCVHENEANALSFFAKRKNCTNLIFSVMVRGTMPFSRTGQMWPYFLQSGHIGATWDMPNMLKNWIHEYFWGKRKMKIWLGNVQRQNVDVDEKKRDALSQVIASVIGEGITNPYPLHGADRHTGKDLFGSENFHHY